MDLIGTVIRSHFIEARKVKRYVIIAQTHAGKYVTALLINSQIPKFALRKPNLKSTYLMLELSGREGYLDKTSYLACGELFTRETRYIHRLIGQNPDRVLGKMSPEDLNLAFQTILSCDEYSEMELINFGILPRE